MQKRVPTVARTNKRAGPRRLLRPIWGFPMNRSITTSLLRKSLANRNPARAAWAGVGGWSRCCCWRFYWWRSGCSAPLKKRPGKGTGSTILKSRWDMLHFACSTEYFPLTLALSLGEREQQGSYWCLADGCWPDSGTGAIESRRTILPLPRGEGRGEGEPSVAHPTFQTVCGDLRKNSLGRVPPSLLHLFSFLVLIHACASDWPQFLGPTRNGVYAGTDLAESWPKEGPPVVWRKKVGQGFSGPAVSGG